jgi:hypothetical protein
LQPQTNKAQLAAMAERTTIAVKGQRLVII